MSKLRVFESFSGVGSMTMALRNLGIDFELVGTSEVDRYAILAYDAIHSNQNEEIEIPSKEEMLKEFEDKHIAYNFSSGKSEIPKGIKDIEKLYKAHVRSKNYGDIQLIDPSDLPNMDLFTYSFPCKNISVAGEMKGLEEGSGTQSSLVWECFKIIEYHKPKYLLMENVKNLVSNKFKPYFDAICNKLEELGYNNYWKVLNGKDFDVPQNRERVMMISIRKDIDKGNFEMPIGTPTTKCLKDVLDNDVEDKYYVQKQMVNKFIPNENLKNPHNIDKQKPTELGFIQKGENGTKHQSNTVYDGDCVSCTLCAGDWKSPKMFMIEGKETKIITHNIYQEVRVRKHEVDIEGLKKVLKKAKKESGLTIKDIANKLNVAKTMVEHWFRNDDCFSIPSEDVWLELKKILDIQTNKFDKSIMEWEIKPNEYDISNRVYDEKGLCPTLTTSGESGTKKILIKNVEQNMVIRKLTPKECWRLMGFTDEDFYKAQAIGLSNTKLYERAGRGIVVPMLEEIFRNLFLK